MPAASLAAEYSFRTLIRNLVTFISSSRCLWIANGAMAEKTFTFEDIQKHTTRSDCWVVIEGKVYDVTKFLDEHPGGGDLLVQASGT